MLMTDDGVSKPLYLLSADLLPPLQHYPILLHPLKQVPEAYESFPLLLSFAHIHQPLLKHLSLLISMLKSKVSRVWLNALRRASSRHLNLILARLCIFIG